MHNVQAAGVRAETGGCILSTAGPMREGEWKNLSRWV